jgi:hypothetical protein
MDPKHRYVDLSSEKYYSISYVMVLIILKLLLSRIKEMKYRVNILPRHSQNVRGLQPCDGYRIRSH